MSDELDVRQAVPAPAGALCALHPTTAAESICARCGNYMCAYCSDRGASECLTCRERAGTSNFPFDRGNWSVFALLDYAWQVFRHYWLKLTLLSAATMIGSQGIALIVGFMSGSYAGHATGARSAVLQLVGACVQITISVGGSLAQYHWSQRAIEARPLDDLLPVLRRVPQALLLFLFVLAPIFAVVLLIGIGVGIGKVLGVDWSVQHPTAALLVAGGMLSLLLIVGAFYMTFAFAFATIALASDPSLTAWQAIKQSWEITSGQRLHLLGLMTVLGVISFVGFMLCLVGGFPALAYAALALTCVYNALCKESPSR